MNEFSSHSPAPNLDTIFAALSDPTRRALLSRLASGEASVGELAAPFEISQPAISRHLKVLEGAGLIEREVAEQRRLARLNARNLAIAVAWLQQFREPWEARLNQLDDTLSKLIIEEREGDTDD